MALIYSVPGFNVQIEGDYGLTPQLALSSPDSPVQMHLSLDSAEVCESLIHAISEKEMRFARNDYNRSGDRSEEGKHAGACHDANDNLVHSGKEDSDKSEYGDGDQSPMDPKVWNSLCGKFTAHIISQ